MNTNDMDHRTARQPLPDTVSSDQLRSEDLILASIPRETAFGRVIHLGCADGSLTVRLPGGDLLGVDPNADKIATARERGLEEGRIRFAVSDVAAIGEIDAGPFDLAVLTGALDDDMIGKTFPLAWAAVKRILRVGSFVIHDHGDKNCRFALPVPRFDRSLYEGLDGLRVLELYRL